MFPLIFFPSPLLFSVFRHVCKIFQLFRIISAQKENVHLVHLFNYVIAGKIKNVKQ